jgi:hypothetical protein
MGISGRCSAASWGSSPSSLANSPRRQSQPHFRQIDSGQGAARITVPVEFLLQWDDEAAARDWGPALFGAASREKTLHANPGRHAGVPAFELESSERFFTRHLLEGGAFAGVAELSARLDGS